MLLSLAEYGDSLVGQPLRLRGTLSPAGHLRQRANAEWSDPRGLRVYLIVASFRASRLSLYYTRLK